MFIYSLTAIVTAALCASAASRDDEVTFNVGTLSFIALAAVLWPITLPFILKKKYQNANRDFSYHQLAADEGSFQ